MIPDIRADAAGSEGGGGGEKRKGGSGSNAALIVDDSKAVRKLIGRVLERSGFQVTSATNGLEGLHMMQAEVYGKF